MAVKAGHNLVDVIVASRARDRKESDGQSNDNREKGLVHDRLEDRQREHHSTQSQAKGSAGRPALSNSYPRFLWRLLRPSKKYALGRFLAKQAA